MSICLFCQSAGDSNAHGDYLDAERLHRLCTDRTCFCQHGVGSQRVERAASA